MEVTISYLHGKHGVEVRLMSWSRDNTHSWVRISHGSNKFVMNLNNETEIPEDQLEEYALELNAKDFACRSKGKATTQRRELAGSSPRIFPIERRNWIDNEPGKYSFSEYEVSKKVISLLPKTKPQRRELAVSSPRTLLIGKRTWTDVEPGKYSFSEYEVSKKVISLLRHSQQEHREEDGAVHFWRIKGNLQNPFPQSIHWSDDRWKACFGSRRGSKKEVSVLLWWFRFYYLFPSFSRTLRTQYCWSFIAGQYCDSERILPIYLPYWMWIQSSFYHQLWISTWRSEFEQETDSILSACWSLGQWSQRF